MQRFFPDFESLNQFTLSLDCQADTLQCPHCSNRGQLVSHGVIYKQRSIDEKEPVGKRVFCSNRNQHAGCGRTVQLYVASVLPRLRYGAMQMFIFLSSLLMNLTIDAAYRAAAGASEPRNAWRWLSKLEQHLTDYRCLLTVRSKPMTACFAHRCRRLQLLLPTLEQLFVRLPTCPCAHYQLARQSAFI